MRTASTWCIGISSRPTSLYSEEGHLQVADLGIAKLDASTLTLTGAVLGTPGYMSPEQCPGAACFGSPRGPLRRRGHPLLDS